MIKYKDELPEYTMGPIYTESKVLHHSIAVLNLFSTISKSMSFLAFLHHSGKDVDRFPTGFKKSIYLLTIYYLKL